MGRGKRYLITADRGPQSEGYRCAAKACILREARHGDELISDHYLVEGTVAEDSGQRGHADYAKEKDD